LFWRKSGGSGFIATIKVKARIEIFPVDFSFSGKAPETIPPWTATTAI
jgi:uncharacterized protein (DUF736 family)